MWSEPTSQASAAAAMLHSGASAGHLLQFAGLSSSENARKPARNPRSSCPCSSFEAIGGTALGLLQSSASAGRLSHFVGLSSSENVRNPVCSNTHGICSPVAVYCTIPHMAVRSGIKKGTASSPQAPLPAHAIALLLSVPGQALEARCSSEK